MEETGSASKQAPRKTKVHICARTKNHQITRGYEKDDRTIRCAEVEFSTNFFYN